MTHVTLLPLDYTPTTVDAGDTGPVNLGVRFYSDMPGNVTGIRFYKAEANIGTHYGWLWSGNTLLAEVTFENETASGWQTAYFSAPVPISAMTAYVINYHCPVAAYSATGAFFASQYDNAPLHGYASNNSPHGNGLYQYVNDESPGVPNDSFNATNYAVDVIFEPGIRTNVTENSSLELDTAGWEIGPAATAFARSTDQSHSGSASLFVENDSPYFGIAYYGANMSDEVTPYAIPVTGGEEFCVSVWLRAVDGMSGNIYFELPWSNNGVSWGFSGGLSGYAVLTDSWQRFSYGGVVDEGITHMGLTVRIQEIIAGPFALYIDDLLVEKGTQVPNSYFDGSTVEAGYTHAWTNTPFESASTRMFGSPPSTTVNFKARESGAWVAHTGVPKVWNGSIWSIKRPKHWNGSAWVDLP